MAHIVGHKGQVVIEKEIRDKLGVEPGWRAIQMLVDDHVEIRFIPPDHTRSLLGVLKPHITRSFATEEELRAAREEAWAMQAEEEMDGLDADTPLRVIRP